MTTALEQVIEWENIWARHRREQPIDITTLTREQANSLWMKLDCDMSPENLTCDGELSRKQVQAKMRRIQDAARELESLGFPMPAEGIYCLR